MRPTTVPVPDDIPDEDQDDGLLDRCRCACGRVASISFEMHDEGPWCAVRCACADFRPAAQEGSPATSVPHQARRGASRRPVEGGRP